MVMFPMKTMITLTAVATAQNKKHAPIFEIIPWLDAEYKRETGEDTEKKWPIYEPAHYLLLGNLIPGIENMDDKGDKVTGERVAIAVFPLNWIYGDGSMVRVVAIEGFDFLHLYL
jgi:kynurenine formamidase